MLTASPAGGTSGEAGRTHAETRCWTRTGWRIRYGADGAALVLDARAPW